MLTAIKEVGRRSLCYLQLMLRCFYILLEIGSTDTSALKLLSAGMVLPQANYILCQQTMSLTC